MITGNVEIAGAVYPYYIRAGSPFKLVCTSTVSTTLHWKRAVKSNGYTFGAINLQESNFRTEKISYAPSGHAEIKLIKDAVEQSDRGDYKCYDNRNRDFILRVTVLKSESINLPS